MTDQDTDWPQGRQLRCNPGTRGGASQGGGRGQKADRPSPGRPLPRKAGLGFPSSPFSLSGGMWAYKKEKPQTETFQRVSLLASSVSVAFLRMSLPLERLQSRQFSWLAQSCVTLTPRTAARQASLSITPPSWNSRGGVSSHIFNSVPEQRAPTSDNRMPMICNHTKNHTGKGLLQSYLLQKKKERRSSKHPVTEK